ncbi:unnamed protein product [Rhizoctonia solani]|uniref:Major facilitator superfamily (MFS) profile domain-containing protein n=1 Tax=Rhizoctonia solani TaxID=456999 RepID=A0A8H3CAR4_9AGAM|nr:unnamed protein product [Rhizoctonia solani]
MSQTATYELELDTFPRLEDGVDSKHLHARAPEVPVNSSNGGNFSGSTTNVYANTMDSGHTLLDPIQGSKAIELGIRKFRPDRCLANTRVKLLDLYGHFSSRPQLHRYWSQLTIVLSPLSLVIRDRLTYISGWIWRLFGLIFTQLCAAECDWDMQCFDAGVFYAGGALLISFAPPFPLVVVGLCLMGLGGGFYEACLTSVASHFEDSRFMNIVYAFSGLGALVSPFIVGALTKSHTSWKLYYWIPFSLTILTTACHYMLFKHYVAPLDHEEAPEHKNVRARFKLAMRMPVTWIGAVLIICSYAIVDVLSNWLTSYLIDVKGSASDISRYQLSVFWAGLTAGRIFFSLPFIHIRERTGNNLLLALTAGAIGLLWGVNTVASNWIAIAVAGFFLGPNTPGILSIISTRLPPSLKEIVVSIAVGSALVGGTLGSLIFGLTVGKFSPGLRLLPPVIIVLASLSALVFWAMPPRRKVD